MRTIAVLAVLTASTSAFADSRTAAEFFLKTCLPAMDDLPNIEIMAREDNWTVKRAPPSLLADNRFRSSRSIWDVTKSEEKFSVDAWINHVGQQDYNVCFVRFLSGNVNREEFLSAITASLELTLFSDTRFAQPPSRNEYYDIKSDRPNPIQLGIISQPDSSVTVSSITEKLRFAIPVPAARP